MKKILRDSEQAQKGITYKLNYAPTYQRMENICFFQVTEGCLKSIPT
jgi:hypothetical protein